MHAKLISLMLFLSILAFNPGCSSPEDMDLTTILTYGFMKIGTDSDTGSSLSGLSDMLDLLIMKAP